MKLQNLLNHIRLKTKNMEKPNKDIETLKDIMDIDNLGLILMKSTRMYNGPFWLLIRRIILNQEKRISMLEKEIETLKKDKQ